MEIYLDSMLIVFDSTTAMAMEEYPETWGSNWIFIDVLILGDFMVLRAVHVVSCSHGVELVMEFHKVGYWLVYESNEIELVRQGWIGRAATHKLWNLVDNDE